MTAHYAFAPQPHDLDGITLQPLTEQNAEILGHALAAMPPWSVIAVPAERLISNLLQNNPSVRRFSVLDGGELAGLISIHEPWLYGPYLQLLAVLPAQQGKGLGLRLLEWMEREARSAEMRQLWLCVSTFNTRARAFYERFGFEAVGVLDQLASGASDELLMRKRLHYGAASSRARCGMQ